MKKPRWFQHINMYEELPRAIQVALGDPRSVSKRAVATTPGRWRMRKLATAAGFAALTCSGPPLLTLASFPATLTMTIRQASQVTWGTGAQIAQANGLDPDTFVDPVADLVGVLALWADVGMTAVKRAVAWTTPKAVQAVRLAAGIPAHSLAAELLKALGTKAHEKINLALIRQILSYRVGGLYVTSALIGGASALVFTHAISVCAKRYYEAKLAALLAQDRSEGDG